MQKKKVCQHSHSSDPVLVHTIHTIHCNILPYAIYRYIEVSALNCTALRCIAILLHVAIYSDSSSVRVGMKSTYSPGFADGKNTSIIHTIPHSSSHMLPTLQSASQQVLCYQRMQLR